MYWTAQKAVSALARWMAIAGGVMLFAVIGLTVVSVTGRAFDGIGLGPVPGDIEMVEIGIGFAVFSTLPYAQFTRAHARVDVFRRLYGEIGNRLLDVIANLLMLGFASLVLWRLWLGMLDKAAYGETTFILQIPLVWGYRGAALACTVGVIVALFCVWRAARRLIGQEA